MVILLTIAFFSTLFFFGWQIARWVLNENRIEHLIAFSGIFGIGLYVFFINIAGLFIPIQTVFYLVLIIFILFASACFLCRRLQIFGDQKSLEWGVDVWWRKILLGSALFFALSVGLISFNSHMDLGAVREPTAVTMAEGNFPPMEIFNPTDPLHYHYAPDLFSAATHKITGMPIHVAYDLQRGILSGVLFLLGFLFIKLFFLDNVTALFSALSMMYAGTFIFFNSFKGIPALYHKFILRQEIPASFKFISDAIVGEYTTPIINSVVTQHWGAMAFALMMAVVYIYFFLLHEENKDHHSIPAFFVGGFLFALLALVSEPYFAVLGVVIFLFPFIAFLFKRDWTSTRKIFFTSLIFLSITTPVAIFQGGLLRPALAQQLHLSSSKNAYDAVLRTSNQSNLNNNSNSFRVGTPWLLNDGKPIYDPEFLVEFTLLLVVLVPALIFLFKRRFQLALFLTGLLLLFFSVPLLVDSDFPDLAGQLGRFFLPIPLFGGLVIGLVLTTLYRRAQKSLLKGSLLLLAFILIAQGLWTHSVWLAFGDPPGTWNPKAKFFAQAGTLETKAYSWVKKNSTIKDLFLIIKDNYLECGVSTVPNCLFILNTGRMAPTFMLTGIWGDTRANTSSPGRAALFSEVSKSCDSDILRKLNYSYVYVDGEWSKGMEAKCIKSNKLNLMFQISEGEKFIRIYKIEEETHPLSSDSAEANTKQVHQVSQVVTDEL